MLGGHGFHFEAEPEKQININKCLGIHQEKMVFISLCHRTCSKPQQLKSAAMHSLCAIKRLFDTKSIKETKKKKNKRMNNNYQSSERPLYRKHMVRCSQRCNPGAKASLTLRLNSSSRLFELSKDDPG